MAKAEEVKAPAELSQEASVDVEDPQSIQQPAMPAEPQDVSDTGSQIKS